MQESKSTASTSADTSPRSPRSPLEIGHTSLEMPLDSRVTLTLVEMKKYYSWPLQWHAQLKTRENIWKLRNKSQLLQPATQCGPHGRHELPTILTKDEIRTARLQLWSKSCWLGPKVPILIQVFHAIPFHLLPFTVHTFFGSFLTADNLAWKTMYPLWLTSTDFQDLAFDLVEAPSSGKWPWSFKRCVFMYIYNIYIYIWCWLILYSRRCLTKRVNVTLHSTTSATWLT